jgi:hypothetical protein
LGVEGYVSDLVADDERDSFEAFELVLQATLSLGVGRRSSPFSNAKGRRRRLAMCKQ